MVFSLRIGEQNWPNRFYQITLIGYSPALDCARFAMVGAACHDFQVMFAGICTDGFRLVVDRVLPLFPGARPDYN
jgi:hypothetical protein